MSTSNYQLNQWDAKDRILREDFNADNAKIDAALATQAEQLAPITEKIGKLGNCQLYTASYTGNGQSTARSMTFPAKPVVVMISNPDGKARTIFWQGVTQAPMMYDYTYPLTITWNGNTVSWYYSGNTDLSLNAANTTYSVAALLDMSV